MKTGILLLVAALSALTTLAQDSARTRSSSVGISFSSVPVQKISGTDTGFVNALSVSPIVELRTRSGWGIVYSPSLVSSAASSGIYMHTLSAGYEKYGGKNADLAFSFSHYIFTTSTQVPYSPLTNEISFYLNYTHSFLRPVVAASFGFGRDTTVTPSTAAHDLAVALGVNHNFSWEEAGPFSSLELTPSVLLNGGTDGYFSFLSTSHYLSHSARFAKMVKRLTKTGGSKKKASALPAASFALSNVEVGLEAELEMGAVSVRPSGSLFFPLGSAASAAPFGYGAVTVQYHF